MEKYAEIKKRSVVIAGHRTSISLENLFWDQLRVVAIGQNKSVNNLITEIDKNRSGNLSSAIRIFVLAHALNLEGG
ncbi:ribbon-helix-helix domain-containing protein [Curvivirga sp.]|uniref:ribbon-helix-helix domain-containing protein n=1 Tax=Curvivirga sp. TaxID=2856848 RepID=UPI003B58C1A9